MKVLIFAAVIKDAKRIILLKIATKILVRSKVMSTYFMQRLYTVHDLSPLLSKRFSKNNALFCDVTDEFNFYKYVSNLKD